MKLGVGYAVRTILQYASLNKVGRYAQRTLRGLYD